MTATVKARLNRQDMFGRTALTYAAKQGFVGIVKVLLEGKAKINVRDTTLKTALGWAKISIRCVECVEELRKALQANAESSEISELGSGEDDDEDIVAYVPAGPTYVPAGPTYVPTSPTYVPTSPTYVPVSLYWSPTSFN